MVLHWGRKGARMNLMHFSHWELSPCHKNNKHAAKGIRAAFQAHGKTECTFTTTMWSQSEMHGVEHFSQRAHIYGEE